MKSNLITIAGFSNTAEAGIVKGALEHAGIQVFLAYESTGSIPEITANFSSGILLQVREPDAPKAKEILSSFNS